MSKNFHIKKLTLENFTVLPNTEFNFSENLNVIISENGFGKTHLLKILYCLLEVTANNKNKLSKTDLEKSFATKLQNVFRPDSLGRLTKRLQGRGKTIVKLELFGKDYCNINFSSNSSTKVNIDGCSISEQERNPTPIFIPSRELLTLSPWFISLYQNQNIPFEETWFDTCSQLNSPLAKGPRVPKIKKILELIEKSMNGKIFEKNGNFYLTNSTGNIEVSLVAEGLRKFAMIARLVATGVLLDKGYLFWDEPEANLNPKLIRIAAKIILDLSKSGIQVFISSHSLFLLREIKILNEKEKLDIKYFSLYQSENGVSLEQESELDEISNLMLLDENLSQSQRYLNSQIQG